MEKAASLSLPFPLLGPELPVTSLRVEAASRSWGGRDIWTHRIQGTPLDGISNENGRALSFGLSRVQYSTSSVERGASD